MSLLTDARSIISLDLFDHIEEAALSLGQSLPKKLVNDFLLLADIEFGLLSMSMDAVVLPLVGLLYMLGDGDLGSTQNLHLYVFVLA